MIRMHKNMRIKYIQVYAILACLVTIFQIPYIKEVLSGYIIIRRYIIFLMLFLLFVRLYYIKLSLNRTFVYLLLWMMYMFAVTVLHSGSMATFIDTFMILLFFSYIPFLADNKKELSMVLRIWYTFLLILLFIDILTIIMYPNGLYVSERYPNNWFLGYKTQRLLYTFSLLVFRFILIFINQWKITAKDIIISFLVIFDIWYSGGTAGTIIVLLYISVMLFLYIERKENKIRKRLMKSVTNIWFFIAMYTAIFCVIVIWQNSSWVQYIIVTLLSKSADFSGRTPIWGRCLNVIIKRPLTGYGMLTSNNYVSITGGFVNPHNMVLTLLLCGGGCGLFLLLVYIIKVVGRAAYSKETTCLIIAIYFMFLLGITSSTLTYSPYTFCFLSLILVFGNSKRDSRKQKK